MNLVKINTVKNSVKKEFDISKNLELLNTQTIHKVEPIIIYKLGTFEKIRLKQIIKTTEETITLHGEELK